MKKSLPECYKRIHFNLKLTIQLQRTNLGRFTLHSSVSIPQAKIESTINSLCWLTFPEVMEHAGKMNSGTRQPAGRPTTVRTNDTVSSQSFLHYKLQILVCLRGGNMYLSIREVEQILIRFISWHYWLDAADLYRHSTRAAFLSDFDFWPGHQKAWT